MALFDHGFTDKFLLFAQHFKMTLEALGELTANAKKNYLLTILHVEALHQFDTLCYQEGSMTIPHLNQVILGLGVYFYPKVCCQHQNT